MLPATVASRVTVTAKSAGKRFSVLILGVCFSSAACCSVDITIDNDAAYADGAASVTPEDGIGQTHVDAAFAAGYDAGAMTGDINLDGAVHHRYSPPGRCLQVRP